MNNDLISREALKKAIEKYRNLNCISTSTIIGVRNVMYLIDNAPTVEPFEPDYVGAERLKAMQRGYEEGYHNGMKIGKTLNPKIKQGEWIYPEKTDKEKGYGGYCSNCKCDMPIFVEDWKQKYCETKFCPNCGAKMKGGKE